MPSRISTVSNQHGEWKSDSDVENGIYLLQSALKFGRGRSKSSQLKMERGNMSEAIGNELQKTPTQRKRALLRQPLALQWFEDGQLRKRSDEERQAGKRVPGLAIPKENNNL